MSLFGHIGYTNRSSVLGDDAQNKTQTWNDWIESRIEELNNDAQRLSALQDAAPPNLLEMTREDAQKIGWYW